MSVSERRAGLLTPAAIMGRSWRAAGERSYCASPNICGWFSQLTMAVKAALLFLFFFSESSRTLMTLSIAWARSSAIVKLTSRRPLRIANSDSTNLGIAFSRAWKILRRPSVFDSSIMELMRRTPKTPWKVSRRMARLMRTRPSVVREPSLVSMKMARSDSSTFSMNFKTKSRFFSERRALNRSVSPSYSNRSRRPSLRIFASWAATAAVPMTFAALLLACWAKATSSTSERSSRTMTGRSMPAMSASVRPSDSRAERMKAL